MIPKTTHTYTTSLSSSLRLKLDIYHPPPSPYTNPNTTPALLYFHGGGLVAMNRSLIPIHIVQSCMKRGWPLISADYELLPQAKGDDLVRNVREAYRYVREELGGVFCGEVKEGVWGGVVVGGSSAGGYLTFLAGHYLDPKPVALISYYAPGNTLSPFFSSHHLLGPSPIPHSQIKHFLDEPATCGDTPKETCFDPAALKGNGEVDEKYEWPNVEQETDWSTHRSVLCAYFLQENSFPEILNDLDVPFSDERWREGYPETVVVHGMEDRIIPIELGREVVGAIGEKARLFTVEGAEHGFDSLPRKIFLGDPKLEVVEKAWAELDGILKSKVEEENLAV